MYAVRIGQIQRGIGQLPLAVHPLEGKTVGDLSRQGLAGGHPGFRRIGIRTHRTVVGRRARESDTGGVAVECNLILHDFFFILINHAFPLGLGGQVFLQLLELVAVSLLVVHKKALELIAHGGHITLKLLLGYLRLFHAVGFRQHIILQLSRDVFFADLLNFLSRRAVHRFQSDEVARHAHQNHHREYHPAVDLGQNPHCLSSLSPSAVGTRDGNLCVLFYHPPCAKASEK